MHIDSLKFFYEVAKSKSISTVAKNSHISQSALSQQLLKIESKLDVKLLNRSNKGVSLTPEGDILFKHTETIINTYNKMLEELSSLSKKKNYISIEAVESISSSILPYSISKLKKIYNYYTINLNTIDCCSNINLLNNICDIHICYKKPEEHTGLITKELGIDELLLVSNINFPNNSITKDELLSTPLIITSDKECLRNSLCNCLNCSDEDLDSLNILYTTNSYFSALNGVLSSKAITFIPKSIYNNYCSITSIKKIDIVDFKIYLPLYLNYLDSFYKNNSEFIKSLKTIIKGFLI
ncbi:LysR family transcriptional regulator [Clostridium carnis]